ncbi:F-box domain cyclin-containing protein [Lasiodiplodia theobromae]|uniref:F-box domain cyclin-containing protein n=1 Tax=Lasiodiplodia theobromae TaxID=45133 RepID=UPI0015C3DB7D|nr:F-box domain cyclin-containing protein [Lasiodiplodia theobromae]KAF4537809.1 F-box domain cyclin-containing protein [Lasiodiplodia theobromae]
MASQSGLSKLSEELVERVFSFLALADIMSILLVCHSFSRIARPFLYRNIVIDAQNAQRLRSIQAFLDHPQHTRSVREAIIYTSEAQLAIVSLSTFTERQQKNLSQRTPVPCDLTRYIDIIGNVVQRMTLLQSLDVRFHKQSDLGELLNCIFRDYLGTSDPAQMFPKLASFRFRPVDDEEEELVRLNTTDLGLVFDLRRIQELTIQNIYVTGDPVERVRLSPALSLKTLVLKECALKPHHISSLIEACPALEIFDCEIMYDAEYAQSVGAYDFSPVKYAICSLKESLQYLRLIIILFTTTAVDIGQPGPWGIRSSIGHSLKTFTKLRKLEISLPVLLGWHARSTASLNSVLPDSLEELFITQETAYWDGYESNDLNFPEEPDYVAICTKVRDYIQGRPKSLHKVKIAVEDFGNEDAMALTQGITEKAVETGVCVEIIEERFF